MPIQAPRPLTPARMVLRCFAQRDGDQWITVCLDLDLFAQDDTFDGAKRRLEAQICSYVTDALVGEDRDHAEALLTRRAPLTWWLKYHWARLRFRLGARGNNGSNGRPFSESMPVQPTCLA